MHSKCLKSFILLMLLNVFALSAFAAEKSLNAASEFLQRPTLQLQKIWDSNDLCSAVRSTTEPTFSVYSGSDGKGFVIVAGERILGYSLDGEISSPENLPEPMRDYLLTLDSELRSQPMASAQKAPGNVVVQLETANWAQRDPYNRMCPEKNGYKCITGCIPTAFAIVMRYHKWPNSGTGKVYNPITGEAVDISSHTYNWDNMLLEYKSGNYTDEQANEVAALMMHLGFAYMVSYGTSNTSGNHNSSTLAKYFGYVDVGKVQRWQVGDTEWVRLIKESLDNGCPIPYAATNSGSGDAKHIFVLDGYTDNNYFHFNWGWGGNGNGYFLLSSMKPATGDNYSKSDSHQAYFSLRPDRAVESCTVSVSATEGGEATVNGVESVTVDSGSQIVLVATANEGYEFVDWTVEGKSVSTDATYTTTVTSSVQYVANFKVKSSNMHTIEIYSTGNGKVYLGDDENATKGEYEHETLVTMHAVADKGYEFHYWAIDYNGYEYPLQGADKDVTINMLSDMIFYAYFKPSTSIGDVEDCNVKISVTENRLNIDGCEGNVKIYTIDGKFLQEQYVLSNATIELPAGTYIVAVDKMIKLININK